MDLDQHLCVCPVVYCYRLLGAYSHTRISYHNIFNVVKHKNLFFNFSFNRRVDASVIEMGKLLYEVKGGGQGQAIAKSEVSAAADAILQPLMDLLDGNLDV